MPLDNTQVAFQTYFGACPTDGPKLMPISLDFTLAGSRGVDIPIDLEQSLQRWVLAFVQAVTIDNTMGGQPIRLTASLTGHSLQINAGRQCHLPFFTGMNSKIVASTGGNLGTGPVKLWLLNFPVPAIVW